MIIIIRIADSGLVLASGMYILMPSVREMACKIFPPTNARVRPVTERCVCVFEHKRPEHAIEIDIWYVGGSRLQVWNFFLLARAKRLFGWRLRPGFCNYQLVRCIAAYMYLPTWYLKGQGINYEERVWSSKDVRQYQSPIVHYGPEYIGAESRENSIRNR